MDENSDIISILRESLNKHQERYEKPKKEVLESDEYQNTLSEFYKTISDFNDALRLCSLMASRGQEFRSNSLFFQNFDHFVESSVALMVLGKDGMRNPARRELRYLLELSLNSLFVDQEIKTGDLNTKMIYLDKKVDTSSINQIKDVGLFLIKDEELKKSFIKDFKKIYGTACTYVHTSIPQIQERLELKERGIDLGFDTENELQELKDEIFNVLSIVIVFLFHALGPSLTGDVIVDGLDKNDDWVYHKSKYYAAIDEHFDYKHERQKDLKEIKERRNERLKR
ncbi:hypothetical protein CK503_15665 [Aliifodinibius salipaludis]|uniref:Uncharacterized protein n=1 Tax=Fodinibius salipaludis TaxID=2032627 RepID=A0A2A2G718_9BACT|nr:hypothetical protein [Aliifodinibius salipaludis]PAU92645.1 hypothetical protein CK503_15665 [Aliifodinibius salipaludis]